MALLPCAYTEKVAAGKSNAAATKKTIAAMLVVIEALLVAFVFARRPNGRRGGEMKFGIDLCIPENGFTLKAFSVCLGKRDK